MDVAVIGAGIGGLSAAIALRRQGELHAAGCQQKRQKAVQLAIMKTAWSFEKWHRAISYEAY